MAMGHLEACEKELDMYLQKVECAKQTLIDAKNAVCKAKLSIQEVPGTVFENDFQKLLLSILQHRESEGQIQEEKRSTSSGTIDHKGQTVTPPHVEQSRIKDEKEKAEDHCKKEDTAVHSTKPWKDRGKMFMKVTSSLFSNGTFWCVPEFNVDKSALRAISERLRKETMSNKSLWNCDTSRKDQIVCVLSKTHNLWLRGLIEKSVSETEVILRYIDYGKTEKVPKNRVNCIPHDMNDLQPLALFCCFQKNPMEVSYDMRWKFKDLTNHKTLVVNIKDEILDGPLPRYVVSLREPDNEDFDIVENLCKEALLQAQNAGMGSSIQSKDVRIYGNVPGNPENLSIVQDVYNSKKNCEEDSRKTEDDDKGKSEIPGDEAEKVDGNAAVAKPDLKIEVEASEEAVNWADLCRTPDVNDNEEHEFLPLDESVFDSDCKVNEPSTDEQQPSSKPGNLASTTSPTPAHDACQTTESVKPGEECFQQDEKKGGDSCNKRLLPNVDIGTTTDENKDQEKVTGTIDEEVKNKADEEIIEDNVIGHCDVDVLKKSQQVIEERLRAASEFSKKKPMATPEVELPKIGSRGDGTLPVKSTEVGNSDNAIATSEVLESTHMTTGSCNTDAWNKEETLTKEETKLSTVDESLGKKEDKAKQEDSAVLIAEDTCSEKENSAPVQDKSQIMIEEKKPEGHNTPHKEVDASVKDDKALPLTSSGANSEFENVSCPEVNSITEKSAIGVDTKKADMDVKIAGGFEQEPAVSACGDSSQATVDSANIKASKVINIANEGDKKSKVSNGSDSSEVAATDRTKKGMNGTSRPRFGNESSSHHRSHHESGRARHGDMMVYDDMKTLPNEDREKWNAAQLKGLQDSVLDKRFTKYFVVETETREIVSAFKTSRYLLTSLPDLKKVLMKHLPQPVILFMVLLTPNEGKRLSAIASVVSKPYSFKARTKSGDWRTIEIFDLKFLCKAKSRRPWDVPFRHQEELKRNIANRLLGEYAKSIKNGLIDKLLDDESHSQGAQYFQPDPTGKASSSNSKPPISPGSDVEQGKLGRQNSAGFEMPPRMKHTSRKIKLDEHSPDAEKEIIKERKDVANPRHDGESSLRVNIKPENEAKAVFESRELWSPTSPSSQPNANLRPISIDETIVASEANMSDRMKEKQHDHNSQQAQYLMLQQYMLTCQMMLKQQQEQQQQQHQHQMQPSIEQPHTQLHTQLQLQQQQHQQQQQQSPEQAQFPLQYSHILQQQQEILRHQQQHAERQHQIIGQPPQPPRYPLTDEQNQIFHACASLKDAMPPSQQPSGVPGLFDGNAKLTPIPSAFGSTSSNEANVKLASNLDDFGSDDEAERDLVRDLDIFGLDEEDL